MRKIVGNDDVINFFCQQLDSFSAINNKALCYYYFTVINIR